MVYFMEHSIKAIHEKEQAAAGGGGGTSPEDKERITKLEDELEDLSGAIESGLTTSAPSTAASLSPCAAPA